MLSPQIKLWLVGEQGLGDQLQFARYAKVLSDRGACVTLACDPRLVGILTDAGLGARIVPFDTATPESQARWMPLMSVPAWHVTGPLTVPFASGYLQADARRIDLWRARLPVGRRVRVALAWAGNPRMETGRHAGRSPPVAALAPLLNFADVSFVSLQKGGEEQLDTVPFGASIQRLAKLDVGTDAFLDTAAVLKCVDLLITSDTAIAHLAGGLGVATWLCLMHDPDWRWGRDGDTTPWYSAMRLFRQAAAGDWNSVYHRAASELASWIATRG